MSRHKRCETCGRVSKSKYCSPACQSLSHANADPKEVDWLSAFSRMKAREA